MDKIIDYDKTYKECIDSNVCKMIQIDATKIKNLYCTIERFYNTNNGYSKTFFSVNSEIIAVSGSDCKDINIFGKYQKGIDKVYVIHDLYY